MLLLPLAASAHHESPASQFTYTVTDRHSVTSTGYTGPGGEVVIPHKIGKYDVTAIGEYAFVDCYTITGVVLPSRLEHIGFGAFAACISLERVIFPASLLSIDHALFTKCWALSELYFEGDAPQGVDDTTFHHSDGDLPPTPLTAYYLPGTHGWSEFTAETGIPAVMWDPWRHHRDLDWDDPR